MRNHMGRVVVPCVALRPLIQAWIDKQDPNEGGDCGFSGKTNGLNKGLARLSLDAGIPVRRISGILNDSMNQQNVNFDTADKLLCGMEMTSEWHSSLSEYYVELEVAPYERDRDVPVLVPAA